MGRLAIVLSSERAVEEGAHVLDVKCDPNDGDNVTAAHTAPSGDDAPPLPGDTAALEDSTGEGNEQVSGYIDTKNAGTAAPGEKRIYARDSDGNVVCEIFLKGTGTVRMENDEGYVELASNGTVKINGLEVDKQGNLSTPGTIVAAEVSNQTVSLGTHVHLSAAPGSPTGPAQGPPPPP